LKGLVTILLALAVLSVVAAPCVEAQGVDVYVNMDKVQYGPGEQGIISISIRNTGDNPIEVKNVTVEFVNWMMFTEDGWDPLGNMTVVYSPAINIASKTGVAKLEDISFTVPTDGRATSTNVRIRIYTNLAGPILETDIVSVLDPSSQGILRAMDNMVLLLTVGAVLAIIAALIIAAAIFLSGRRPRAMWTKQE
jgi:hypothetical protein